MDIQSLLDLSQHFSSATHILPMVADAAHQVTDTVQNVFTAITDKNAMTPSERLFQVGKLAVSTVGMAAAFATGAGALGVIGFAIPEVEAVRELSAKGAAIRATHG